MAVIVMAMLNFWYQMLIFNEVYSSSFLLFCARCCWSPVRQRKRRAYHFAHFRGLYPTSVLNGLLCHVWGAGTQHRSERRTGRSFFNTERHTLLSDNRKNDQRLRSLWKGFPDSMPFNTSSLLLLLYHKKFCKSDGREPRRQDWASMS